MRYALTGDSGMLASVLDEYLKTAGHVRVSPPAQEVPRWVSPSTGAEEPDFRSPVYLAWLDAERPDAFFHSGALVGTTRCEAHAEDAWSCNVSAVQALADVLSRRGVYTVLLATAAEMEPAAYGLDRPIEVNRTPANPLTRYGMTKLAGRLLMESTFRERGVQDHLLQVYPSFGFGGMRDGNSCVADLLKCAAGVYDRRPFLPLDPLKVKEVTPHEFIAEVITHAAEKRLSGKIPVASGLWLQYGEIVRMVEEVTGVDLDPEWRADLDYKGDFVHAPEDLDRLQEVLGVGRMTEPDLRTALKFEWMDIREGGGVEANHEWRFADKLAEAFPGWEGRQR
jgi:nucleoside-diphosphate-sugar epimerase